MDSNGNKIENPAGINRLGGRESTPLVEAVQTWKYSVDARQHGFFLAKKLRKVGDQSMSSLVLVKLEWAG